MAHPCALCKCRARLCVGVCLIHGVQRGRGVCVECRYRQFLAFLGLKCVEFCHCKLYRSW